MKNNYHTIFISDVHLGMRFIDSSKLLKFLRNSNSSRIFIVGDFVDGWALSSIWYWPDVNSKIIKELYDKSTHGTEITIIAGNHDEFLRNYVGISFGNIKIVDKYIYKAMNEKSYLIIHGDLFDSVIQYAKWLVFLSDHLYNFIFMVNFILSKIPKNHFSLSQWCKNSVKSVLNFITHFENILCKEAELNNCNGVICGHIHKADIKKINEIEYMNCGDWTESHNCLVEDLEGNFKIINFK